MGGQKLNEALKSVQMACLYTPQGLCYNHVDSSIYRALRGKRLPMIEFHGVSLIYPNGVTGLSDIAIQIQKGEFVFLVGPTGSGKSSFLKLIYREVIPSGGEIFIDGHNLSDLTRRQIPYLRRNLGVVFQDFSLLPNKTVHENVAYALEVIGTPRSEIPRRVDHALHLVGLEEKTAMFPRELSGGEQQRTSIARALVNHPLILLADEPTGNLDPETSWEIMQLLARINTKGTTVVVATHDKHMVDLMRRRVVYLQQGRIIGDQERGTYTPEEAEETALPLGGS